MAKNKKGGPYLPQTNPPKDWQLGLEERALKKGVKRQLEIKDRQDAVERYVWKNIPMRLTSEDIERLIYIKGQLVMFYYEGYDEYFLMPYALDGGIDFYGRYLRVHPVPYADGVNDYHDKKHQIEKIKNLLSQKKLRVIYDDPEKYNLDNEEDECGVILKDYTEGYGPTIVPRVTLQKSIIELQSDLIPYMRTALKNSTGVEGVRVSTEDEASSISQIAYAVDQAAINGLKYVGVIGSVEFQELTGGTVAKAEEFMQAFQSIDNYRLSLYGISNGGVYEKKAHMLGSEQEMNEVKNSSPLQNGLNIRKHFCDICNSLWGLNMSVEINPDVQQGQEDGEDPLNDDNEPGGDEDGNE